MANNTHIQFIPPMPKTTNNRGGKYEINQIKLNEQGFPILEGMQTLSEDQKVKVSNAKDTRLKGFRDDPGYVTKGRGSEGIIRKYNGLPYKIQRKIAREFIIMSSILRLRTYQTTPYSRRSEDDDRPGIKIVMKDPDKEPTDADEKEMKEFLDHVVQTGRRDFPGSIRRKDRLPQFTEKVVRDLLTLDRVAISRRVDRKGDLVDFVAIDAATIYPVDPYVGYEGDRDIAYVQEIDGRVVETFKEDELIVDWMYQSTDIEHHFFGWSGQEEAFREIRATIDAFRYNHGNFTQNRAPKGYFVIPEELDDDQLDEMEERWNALFNGADTAFRTPFFSGSEKIQYQKVGDNNRDMEYDKYMQHLLMVLFSNFSVDPLELGIKLDRAPQGGLRGEGSVEAQQQGSVDRGLGAVLDFMARILNRLYEGSEWSKKYEIVYSGRRVVDRDKILDSDVKKLTNFMTIDEIRARHDEKSLWQLAEERLGDLEDEEERKKLIEEYKKEGMLILNPQYIQVKQAAQQAAQQEAMQAGGEGGPPGEGDEGGDIDTSELEDHAEDVEPGETGADDEELGDLSDIDTMDLAGDEGEAGGDEGDIGDFIEGDMEKSRVYVSLDEF